MNGSIFPPIGQRERMQFRTINETRTVATYSRGCTVVRSDFVLVRIPVDAEQNLILDDLSEDDRRFVEHNITPAEWNRAKDGKICCGYCGQPFTAESFAKGALDHCEGSRAYRDKCRREHDALARRYSMQTQPMASAEDIAEAKSITIGGKAHGFFVSNLSIESTTGTDDGVSNGEANVSGSTDPEEGSGRSDEPGGGDQGSD